MREKEKKQIMTVEEAVQWLKLDIDLTKFDPMTGGKAYLTNYAKRVIEAEEMAIEVLEEKMKRDERELKKIDALFEAIDKFEEENQ